MCSVDRKTACVPPKFGMNGVVLLSESVLFWWRESQWGGICGQERTPLVIINGNLTAQRYINDILCSTALTFFQKQPRGVISTLDPIQLESYKTSVKPTTSSC